MPCETAEIAEQIGAFLARGTGSTEHRPKKKKNLGHTFLPNRTYKKFRPYPMVGN